MAKTPDTDNNAYREYGLLDPGLLRLRARIGKDISPADVADIIDNIGIITIRARERIRARAAVQSVGRGVAADNVAGQCAGAADRVITGTSH